MDILPFVLHPGPYFIGPAPPNTRSRMAGSYFPMPAKGRKDLGVGLSPR